MSQTYSKKLLSHSSHYFISQFLVMFTGLISFPILTRLFSKEDYGLLSLVNVTIMMLVPFAKLGLQHSSVRFYSEYKEGHRSGSMPTYYATIFLGSVVVGLGIVFAYCLILTLVNFFFLSTETVLLFYLAGAIVLMRALYSTYLNIFRAEQRTKRYALISCATSYFTLGAILAVLFFAIKSVFGFFLGMLTGELIVLVCLSVWFLSRHKVHPRYFSMHFFKDSVTYGFPLITLELASLVLAFSDRYLIQYFMGSASVGIFSVASNLCRYVQQFMSYPILLAIIPIYMELWVKQGKEETIKFIEQTFYYYILVGIPVIFGFVAISHDVVTLLASSKFAQAVNLIPFIISGSIAFGAFPLFAAGLYIHNKTGTLAVLVALSSFLNVLLNILLLPICGLIGSAFSMCISFLALILTLYLFSRKYLPFRLNAIHSVKCLAASIVMYHLLKFIVIDNLYVAVAIKIPVGILVYFTVVLILNSYIRDRSVYYLRRFAIRHVQ